MSVEQDVVRVLGRWAVGSVLLWLDGSSARRLRGPSCP
jgi:hypothetical protein